MARGKNNLKIEKSKHKEVYAYYKTGKTLREVGQKYGVSRERIRQIFNNNNFKQRKFIFLSARNKFFIDVDEYRFYLTKKGSYSSSIVKATLQNYLWTKYFKKKVPKNKIVIFKDGNHKNIKKNNLKLKNIVKLNTKCSAMQIRRMFADYRSGIYSSYEQIGKKYGICTMGAWKIINGKSYKWVEEFMDLNKPFSKYQATVDGFIRIKKTKKQVKSFKKVDELSYVSLNINNNLQDVKIQVILTFLKHN